LENVFAGGSVVRPLKMAVQAVEQGKNIAFSVNQFLETGAASGLDAEFNSQMGKLQNGEMSEFLRDVNAGVQIEPAAGIAGGYSGEEAIAEAQRCLHCDCGKPFSCKLREYATLYDARQQRYKIRVRAKFEKINQHIQVIYEPGKCIKCGLCVQITEKAQEKPGLTFIGRGFNVKIGVPFNDSFAAALEKVARECVQACPTGALVLKMQEDEDEN
jgi:ferredoxin